MTCSSPSRAVGGLGAAFVALAVDLGAVILARYQGLGGPRITFFLVAVGALALVSLLAVAFVRRVPLAADGAMYGAAAGYLSLGLLSLPSVGLGLIGVGLIQLWGAGPSRIRTTASFGASAVAVGLVLAGFALTR